MATPEGRIKAALDRMLKAERVWFYPPQAGPFGSAGIPDRVAIVAGIFVGIWVPSILALGALILPPPGGPKS